MTPQSAGLYEWENAAAMLAEIQALRAEVAAMKAACALMQPMRGRAKRAEAERDALRRVVATWVSASDKFERAVATYIAALEAERDALQAEVEAMRADVERWEYIETVWTCYAEVRLVQEEDGRWSLHLEEGIECADDVYFGGDPIAAIYVTTLQRTAQTAAPLSAALELRPRVEPDLREVFLGEWEGGIFRERVAAGDPIFAQVITEERWDRIPAAEPADEFGARLEAAIGRIHQAHPDERVVAFSHGGVIGHLLHLAARSRPFAFAGADNASVSELVVLGSNWTVRLFNQTTHLD